mmetsp:Transcript_5151/g.6230  ORF Transcript_5151/g.6230 Transcript_5151/m.6230 type:complete len:82 (+) Transcript_5151:190-435(+)
MDYKSELVLPFTTQKYAEIAKQTLEVDGELRPELTRKEFTVEEDKLLVKIYARDAKTLRTSVSSFCDYVLVVIRTINEFGT